APVARLRRALERERNLPGAASGEHSLLEIQSVAIARDVTRPLPCRSPVACACRPPAVRCARAPAVRAVGSLAVRAASGSRCRPCGGTPFGCATLAPEWHGALLL